MRIYLSLLCSLLSRYFFFYNKKITKNGTLPDRVSDPHFSADPDPGKNLHADPVPDPDPGGIRGRGLGVKGKN